MNDQMNKKSRDRCNTYGKHEYVTATNVTFST